MTAPPWRLENFAEEFLRWRETYRPSPVWQRLVRDRGRDLENHGPTIHAVYLSETDSFECLETITGTTASISCLVWPREGRIVVVDIRS